MTAISEKEFVSVAEIEKANPDLCPIRFQLFEMFHKLRSAEKTEEADIAEILKKKRSIVLAVVAGGMRGLEERVVFLRIDPGSGKDLAKVKIGFVQVQLPEDQEVDGKNFWELSKKAKIFSPELVSSELTVERVDQLEFVRKKSVVGRFDEVAATKGTLAGYMELSDVPIRSLGYRPFFKSVGCLAKNGSYSRVGEFISGKLRAHPFYNPELGCDFEIRISEASPALTNVFGTTWEDEKILWLGNL